MSDEEKKPLTREEKEAAQLEKHLGKLHQLRGIDGEEVKGYVYREVMGGSSASLPPVDRVLMDHELGQLYGPGKYKIVYMIFHGAETTRATERYTIGREFALVHRQFCEENGLPCYLDANAAMPGERAPKTSFMDFLGGGKAQELLALAAGIKQLLGNGANDQKEILIELIKNQNRPAQGMGESIVAKALEMMGQPKEATSPAALLSQQLDMFSQLKNTFASEKEEGTAPMGFWEKGIEMALAALPQILQQNNGNIDQAAKQLKAKNASLRIALGIPSVQKQAYQELTKRYGQSQADKWALGFGLNPANLRGEVAALDDGRAVVAPQVNSKKVVF